MEGLEKTEGRNAMLSERNIMRAESFMYFCTEGSYMKPTQFCFHCYNEKYSDLSIV